MLPIFIDSYKRVVEGDKRFLFLNPTVGEAGSGFISRKIEHVKNMCNPPLNKFKKRCLRRGGF